jgi:hypothetical protein
MYFLPVKSKFSRIQIYVSRLIKSRIRRLTGHVARLRENKNAYSNFMWKPEDKNAL